MQTDYHTDFNFAAATLRVGGAVDPQSIVNRVRELGFDVAIPTRLSGAPPTANQSGATAFARFLLARRN